MRAHARARTRARAAASASSLHFAQSLVVVAAPGPGTRSAATATQSVAAERCAHMSWFLVFIIEFVYSIMTTIMSYPIEHHDIVINSDYCMPFLSTF